MSGEKGMRMDGPEPGHADEHAGHGPMAGPGMPTGGATHDAMAGISSGDESDPAMAHGQATPWAHAVAAIILGAWLITSPFALDYRSTPLMWSDVISGALIIVLATLTVARRSTWAPWANSLVGVWLLFAPLVFWAPTGAAFVNDTLSGALVIAFVLLMPGMPGMRMLPGPDRPPGWSYNPSSWPQRAPVIALAFVAFFLSRQMAAYQLGYTTTVWEPFFTPGTAAILTSDVSKAFPISDAGLGAVAYLIEGLMGFMGDKQRWRTMPWMVMFFGILVVPLGLVSIGLIILQPVAVGTWGTPPLLAALAMLTMIALTLDEVVAMVAFLVQARREGQPLWRTFWLGGTLAETGPDIASVRPDRVDVRTMLRGVAVPWNLLASVALGLWVMASPAIFGTAGNAAHSDHIVGALAVTVAIISLADVSRTARFINVLLGAWLVAAPLLVAGGSTASSLSGIGVGALLIALSFPRGPIGESYGSWSRYIR